MAQTVVADFVQQQHRLAGGKPHGCPDGLVAAAGLQVGDIVEFSLCYSHMLYATARSDMRIIFKNQSAQEE